MRRRNLLGVGGKVNVEGYLAFEVLTPTRFKFSGTSSNTLQCSINGNAWQDLANNTYTSTLNQGDKIYFKGNCTPVSSSAYGIGKFVSSGGTWNAKGTPMSLLYGDNFSGQTSLSGKNYAFCYLFSGCTTLQSAENLSLPATTLAYMCYHGMFYDTNVLPDCTNIDFASSTVVQSGGLIGLFAGTTLTDSDLNDILESHGIYDYSLPCMTLAESCYESMFEGCTSLTTAPSLPATTLAWGCYTGMFRSCTSLTTVPSDYLPATTLAEQCYNSMFYRCSNLTTAPSLPATTLAQRCYSYMFRSCTSLTTVPSDYLPATTLADSCYYYMFDDCTSLETAPELPATTLAYMCYNNMFSYCSSLTTAPSLPATTLADSCYSYMFYGCTSLTTVPSDYLPATTLADSCYYNMFGSCTSLTTAPELPATTLAYDCYDAMFYDCTSLTTVPSDYLPATTLAEQCYNSMFYRCSNLTTAPSLPATTLAQRCYSYMFEFCTSLITAPELPATTLARFCYQSMFFGCRQLSSITCLATNISALQCTINWVNDVASSGTFTKAASMSNWSRGTDGIPNGWTVQDY